MVGSGATMPVSHFPRFKAGMIEGPLWSQRSGPFFTVLYLAVFDLLSIWEPLTGPWEFRIVTGFGLGHMSHLGAGDGQKPVVGE